MQFRLKKRVFKQHVLSKYFRDFQMVVYRCQNSLVCVISVQGVAVLVREVKGIGSRYKQAV